MMMMMYTFVDRSETAEHSHLALEVLHLVGELPYFTILLLQAHLLLIDLIAQLRHDDIVLHHLVREALVGAQ